MKKVEKHKAKWILKKIKPYIKMDIINGYKTW